MAEIPTKLFVIMLDPNLEQITAKHRSQQKITPSKPLHITRRSNLTSDGTVKNLRMPACCYQLLVTWKAEMLNCW